MADAIDSSSPASSVDHSQPVRNKKGHWVKGGPSPNPKGRPSIAKEREYLKTLREVVTLDEWRKIAEKAVQQAKLGNRYARDWLARYLVPEPAKAIDVDGTLSINYVNDWRNPSEQG